MKVEIALDGKNHQVELAKVGERLRCAIDGVPLEADAVQIAPGIYSILIDGESMEVRVELDRRSIADYGGGSGVARGDSRSARVATQSRWRGGGGGAAAGFRADAGENRSRSRRKRRFCGCKTGLVCGGSDENAERNSVAEIRKSGTAARHRRANCECRGSSRDHRLRRNIALPTGIASAPLRELGRSLLNGAIRAFGHGPRLRRGCRAPTVGTVEDAAIQTQTECLSLLFRLFTWRREVCRQIR